MLRLDIHILQLIVTSKYIVSVHGMDMENRPVDPGSMEGTNFGSSGICFFFFFWDGVFGDSRSDYLCFLGGVLVF